MAKETLYSRAKRYRYFKEALILIGLVVLFLLVQWMVKALQKPGHMGVIESQSMEMTVQPPEGAMPVQMEIVEPYPFANAVTYTGSAVAYNEMAIFPRVEGRIVSMPVYPGDRVRPGQLLAQLDTRELTSRVNEAQAGQTAATQQYYASLRQQGQASAQVQRAQQAIQAARANQAFRQEQIRRSRALVAEDVITREEAQRDESDYVAAQSQYQQAQTELRAVQQGAAAASFQASAQQAQARQAGATAQTQSIIRSYTRITAPQSGVVTQRLVSPGTLVGPGMQILQVSQIHPIRIQANVAESDLALIHVGNPVTIWNQKNKGGKPIQAKVTAVFPRADLQTRTAVVEAVIPNTEEQFIPGDFVTVSIQTGQQTKALTVPNTSIVDQGGQQAVWAVEDGKAHLQFVTTGGTDGNRTAIVNGLRVGETVITQGNQNLTEGVLVTQATYGPQGLKALPRVVSTNRLTPENQYQIKRSMGHYLLTLKLQTQPPKTGNNELTLEIMSGPGMNMPTDNLSVDMTTVMSSMPTMPTAKPTIRKVGEGQFKAKAILEMPGLWQVNVMVRDGSTTLGTFPVEIKVPE